MAQKRILIITYYWPPAGGPGVQRWLKFTKYLPEFGWKPTVFIPENPSYPIIDHSLVEEVPHHVNVIRSKIWEPYRFAEKLSKKNEKFKGGQFDVGKKQSWKSRLSIWVRGNFFIPDARVFWVKPSAKYLKKYLRENHFDAVVTTGPPHSLHLIGLALKKDFPDFKWIADFRDPWTEISYYKHLKLAKNADRKHRKLEKMVFQQADITLATSFADAESFSKKGANAICITNGFDTEPDSANSNFKGNNGKFTLAYIGILEQLRNPSVLWAALSELVNEQPDFATNLELRFVGRVDEHILNELASVGLFGYIIDTGYVEHQRSVKEMNEADLLLITNFPDPASRGIIPGKIFEYLATGNRIISFGPADADVEKILAQTEAGKHFQYTEHAAAKNFILETFREWQNNGLTKNSKGKTEIYSRRNLTRQLAEIL